MNDRQGLVPHSWMTMPRLFEGRDSRQRMVVCSWRARPSGIRDISGQSRAIEDLVSLLRQSEQLLARGFELNGAVKFNASPPQFPRKNHWTREERQ